MDQNFIQGQTLIVELKDECYIGEFSFINKDHTRIELIKVSDFQTGEIFSGAQHFYKADIKSIKIIKKDYESVISSEGGKEKIDTECESKSVDLTIREFGEIDRLTKSAKYIYQTDRVYHEALQDMWRQNEIAINIEGCEMGRHNDTYVLTVCTKGNAYIFDVVFLGRIFPEIKEIFEARRPRKIVHDGRRIADNLQFKQNIQLSSVFDTLIAHVAVGKEKNYIDLATCVKRYINVPDTVFACEKDIDWHSRPLDDDYKAITAKKTIYLYKLYEVFMNYHMLQNFYSVCSEFAYTYSHNLDSVEVASDMASSKNTSLDQISDVDCDLSFSVDQISLQEWRLELSYFLILYIGSQVFFGFVWIRMLALLDERILN